MSVVRGRSEAGEAGRGGEAGYGERAHSYAITNHTATSSSQP